MKNKKTSKPEKSSKNSSSINTKTSASSSKSSTTSKTKTSSFNTNTPKNTEKILIDFKEILKPSLITTNQNINFSLYLELMNNLDKKDDLKTLAICRLILSEDPNNTKIKELHDLIYEEVKNNYYETGKLEKEKDEKMDKHMKLNKDGEYEYYFSDEDESEEDSKSK